MSRLNNLKVAILTENGFEESELLSPKTALEAEGAQVHVISPQKDMVRSWKDGNWGMELKVDKDISEAQPSEYDAVMLPGGVMNPDKLRMNKDAVRFVEHFFETGKPIAAICHGPQTLIETDMLKGKEMTSYPSLKTDLENAGVRWVDKEVVVDNGLVTSRSPKDLPAFNKKMIEEFAEGIHHGRKL